MLRDQKITLGQMRRSGPGRLHVLCGDDKCCHSIVIDADCWPGSLRLSDVMELFVCRICGHRGADLKLDDQEAEPGLQLRPTGTSAENIS